ncbi:CDP-diacylglycerol--glycerol-3-phosphate 3-phosphatidyltransferase [Frigoribacterium sp. VKM Ac-2836]|uniref:CDP-diacylglycerol--glycerol-3-phosphate 3-phosphatidyltransferase n=1 Tax=Frigoribacterium sp. VKM Ac-2836 TaxID=2739014 RepID=UPI001563A312|nr:CDP-diacylglycerol--glycerol-3-phosphate 3-phosphatidyltransferase [Frigoribacterium sp. VKM Ac-2836]NRD27598.1 CDP-diacylglycerol--glycerol-3-phosphate 3-phosphatidyltransferase [Frigoribacterium sp. VKM Ac-2836]
MSHHEASDPVAPRPASSFRGRFASKGPGPASTANIANVITVVRILMAPVFIAWLLIDDGADGSLRVWAAALFVVAILTDSLDGMLARGLDLVTDFGKIVDPIADKVLIGGALVSLTILGELPWWVTALILVREIGITVYRFAVLRDRVIPASRGGKIKTVLQAVAVTSALFPLWNVFGEGMHWVNGVLMTAATVATLLSGADYMRVALRHGKADA